MGQSAREDSRILKTGTPSSTKGASRTSRRTQTTTLLTINPLITGGKRLNPPNKRGR
jgi:hypothetical protein